MIEVVGVAGELPHDQGFLLLIDGHRLAIKLLLFQWLDASF